MDTGLHQMLAAALFLVSVALAAWDGPPADEWGPPVVGAIRWDAWVRDNEWEKNLAPTQWRHRLPFYAREVSEDQVEVRGDSQQVMDQEIAYAQAAGLDYWAYCYSYSGTSEKPEENYGLKLHLASKRKADMNYSLILMGQGYWGPKEGYPQAVDVLVRHFQEPNYQRVAGGRPLLFVFYVESMSEYFGSEQEAREGLNLIRDKAIAAGLKPPYLVAQVWSAQSGAEYVDKLGFDAISAYAWVDFSHGDQEYPYHTLAQANQDYWEACKAIGKQVVPIVSAGWDTRPRWRDVKRFEETYKSSPRGPWYTEPTPAELAENLRAAIEWNRRNRDQAPANAVIIYAWNESDEGGWLVPTKAEGTARLDTIRAVLEAARPSR